MAAKGYEHALKHVRSICLALPETHEVLAWGHPTFRAGKKIFAAFGGNDDEMNIGLNVGFERQEELLNDDRFFPTPYAVAANRREDGLERSTWLSRRSLSPSRDIQDAQSVGRFVVV